MCFRARLLEVDGGGHEGLALLEHGQRVLAAPRLIAVHLQEVALREGIVSEGKGEVLVLQAGCTANASFAAIHTKVQTALLPASSSPAGETKNTPFEHCKSKQRHVHACGLYRQHSYSPRTSVTISPVAVKPSPAMSMVTRVSCPSASREQQLQHAVGSRGGDGLRAWRVTYCVQAGEIRFTQNVTT